MIYIISIIIVLGVLVFVHELGHFLAAKLFGVRVERFSIGFPPRLFGVTIGETDYCVSIIPLGGYVKLSGMIDESMDVSKLEAPPEPHEFRAKPMHQKLIIIAAGVIMNFLLAIAILTGGFWLQEEKLIPSTTVGMIGKGGISEMIGFETNDVILEVANQPVQYWQDVGQLFFENLGRDIHFKVERNSQIEHLVLRWADVKLKDFKKLDIKYALPAKVGALSADFPAQKAGLQTGDLILAINDSAISSWSGMTDIIASSAGVELKFTIRRGDETRNVNITPKLYKQKDITGQERSVGIVGIQSYLESRKRTFTTALSEGFQQTILIGALNLKGFMWIISGKESPKDMLVGPIGITKIAGDMAQSSLFNLIPLIAQLSIVLAIINILPIPALDGGHLVIILIEGIRRRPISIKAKMMVQQIGMVFLLMLIFFVLYNDLIRLFN